MTRPFQGLVLHIQEGTEDGTDSWFHNPASQVSAHFGNPKSGGLDQWVDTDDKAWAQVAGNRAWISIENEGHSGDSLTDSQCRNAGILLAWLNLTESVPLTLAESATDSGLGYHSMGGAAWGDHSTCPGQPIVDQRPAIISVAQSLVSAPVVTGISPASGGADTPVVIAGSGFTFATSVGFGNTSVTQMSVDSDTQITVTAPMGSGTVDVVVIALPGTSATSTADQFTYT
ncbi:MAG: N-acetylmuramoyl-L-alanine amidase [Candidatus Cybelea sp.]